jgi:hypothetical protein
MSTWQVFRWPLGIAAFTLFGLIAGLASDGWGDALAAAALAVPACLSARALFWKRGSSS